MLTKAEIQRLRSLQDKKHRDALGLFVVEGEKVVRELLAEGFEFEEILVTPAWSPGPSREEGRGPLAPRQITPEEMARVSHFPTPSPVLAVGRLMRRSLAPAELERGFTLALDGVQDAGNVGTLVRIADWYGFARVICAPDCADVFGPKAIHASMGSFSRVPVYVAPLASALSGVTVPVLGCDLAGEDIHGLEPLSSAIVVVGSEGRGLSAEVKRCVSRTVTIPRYGRAESLNAAMAAAIVCDNLRRLAPR